MGYACFAITDGLHKLKPCPLVQGDQRTVGVGPTPNALWRSNGRHDGREHERLYFPSACSVKLVVSHASNLGSRVFQAEARLASEGDTPARRNQFQHMVAGSQTEQVWWVLGRLRSRGISC